VSLVEHAKRELALIDNDQEFTDAIIRAVEGFASYGHSGGSASVAIPMLNALLQHKNLTPLTNDPAEWMNVGNRTWQCVRNPHAFSSDGGLTYYLLTDRDRFEDDLPVYVSKKKEP
jgi:hypothetical protein